MGVSIPHRKAINMVASGAMAKEGEGFQFLIGRLSTRLNCTFFAQYVSEKPKATGRKEHQSLIFSGEIPVFCVVVDPSGFLHHRRSTTNFNLLFLELFTFSINLSHYPSF